MNEKTKEDEFLKSYPVQIVCMHTLVSQNCLTFQETFHLRPFTSHMFALCHIGNGTKEKMHCALNRKECMNIDYSRDQGI